MPASGNGQPQSFASAVSEVSERVSVLVRDEIELAKTEVAFKVKSIGRGAVAVAAGAVFGVFALIFALLTLAWGIDSVLVNGAGDLWIGFGVVFLMLLAMTVGAFLFAWRKLRVGAPAPTMAIQEARLIKETVSSKTEGQA